MKNQNDEPPRKLAIVMGVVLMCLALAVALIPLR